MFARFGHAAYNTFAYNENRHDADSGRGRPLTIVGPSAKATTAVTAGAKTYTPISVNAGNPAAEAGG